MVAPPPPHSIARGGRMRIPIFSGKGVFLAAVSGSRENPEKGGVFFVTANGNQYPRYIGVYPFPEIGGSGDGERA